MRHRNHSQTYVRLSSLTDWVSLERLTYNEAKIPSLPIERSITQFLPEESQFMPPKKPSTPETSRQIIVRLTIDTHRALRVRVAEEDTSIQKWVNELVERELGVSKSSKKK